MSLQEEEDNQRLMTPVRLDKNGTPTFSRQNAVNRRLVEPAGVIPDNKRVVFFDNDEYNIQNMTVPNMTERFFLSSTKSKIHGILIDDKIKNPLFEDNDPANIDYSELTIWDTNTYAKYIRDNGFEHRPRNVNGKMVSYPPDEGVNEGHLEMLRNWLIADAEKKTLIFDWDRTLAVTEGVAVPRDKATYKIGNISEEDSIKHVIEYVMGGSDRVKLFQDFFSDCQNLGVNVLIITNNGSALAPSRQNFLKLVQQVIPQMDDSRLLASRSTGGDKFKSYKKYVKSHPQLGAGLGGTRRIRQKKTRRRSNRGFGRTRRRQQ
jgi:hypothetical protein